MWEDLSLAPVCRWASEWKTVPGLWRQKLKASWSVGLRAPGLEDILTWPPYSCSDLAALYWVCTSRRPFGWLCSSSEQFYCTLAASRWSLWKVPEGTRRQNVTTSILSAPDGLCRSEELRVNSGIFLLFGAAAFGNFPQRPARSARLAHLQVDYGVCAVALHGVELQVPLEVLGVEARDGQTVAEASLQRRRGDQGFKEALFSVTLQAATLRCNKRGFCSSAWCLQVFWERKNGHISIFKWDRV